MNLCRPLTFETPDGYLLNGLWFGGDSPKRVYIFLHGLNSSTFALTDLLPPLTDEGTAALYFSNRGSGFISKIKKRDTSSAKGYTSEVIGCSHEVFTDCIDDIKGAVDYAKAAGATEIFLVGHSTGCQKSFYYASDEQRAKNLSGVVVLCPLSDYAYALSNDDVDPEPALKVARQMVTEGNEHKLLPEEIWPYELVDAQRFISLYTPDSAEEIFSYWDPDAKSETYKSVTLPVLAVFAAKDEYGDRPATELADWFRKNSASQNFDSLVVEGAIHNLFGHEETVSNKIGEWAK